MVTTATEGRSNLSLSVTAVLKVIDGLKVITQYMLLSSWNIIFCSSVSAVYNLNFRKITNCILQFVIFFFFHSETWPNLEYFVWQIDMTKLLLKWRQDFDRYKELHWKPTYYANFIERQAVFVYKVSIEAPPPI